MNYTNWLLATFPELADRSSAETFKLVETAKSETQAKRLASHFFAIFSAAVLTHIYLLPALGLVPLESIVAWIVFIVALAFSAMIASAFERNMIRKVLTNLVTHED